MGDESPINDRVLRLELTVENHKEELKELRDASTNLSKSLQGIEKSLQQIKWVTLGAAIVVFGKNMGLDTILKAILGVL